MNEEIVLAKKDQSWPKRTEWNAPTSKNLASALNSHKLVESAGLGLVLGAVFINGGMPFLPWWGNILLFIGLLNIVMLSLPKTRAMVLSFKGKPWFKPEEAKRVDELLVTVRIYVEGNQTGQDCGVLGIEGSLVFFAGAASSFALGREDIDFDASFERQWKSTVTIEPNSFLMRIKHPKVKLELVVTGDASKISELADGLKKLRFAADSKEQFRSFPPIYAPEIYSRQPRSVRRGRY